MFYTDTQNCTKMYTLRQIYFSLTMKMFFNMNIYIFRNELVAVFLLLNSLLDRNVNK